ncbi:hypothetical protein E4U38_006407 [Claviceps purpurea]|nr:hypothetical protein E4U38_006407 [Claviceps purpurea]
MDVVCPLLAFLALLFAINNSSDPIWLNPNPTTFDDAASDLHAFSTEGRSEARFRYMPGAVEYSNSTALRLRECYGWMSISGKELWALPPRMQPPEYKVDRYEVRYISPTEEYRAIVYTNMCLAAMQVWIAP